MTDWGRSGRRNTYSACYVEPFSLQETGREVETLADMGSISWDINSDNYYSATLNLAEEPTRDFMIRVKQHIEVDGDTADLVLGTFFIEKCHGSISRGQMVYQVQCYSPMLRYTKDITVYPVFWPEGTRVQDAIRQQVAASGGILNIIEGMNMERTFGGNVMFPANFKVNEMIDEMAYWIGCKIYPDEFGYITLAPYEPAEGIPRVYKFDATNCVYKRGYSIEDLASDSYNRWVVYYANAEASDMAISTLPQTHPYSFDRIGRYVTYSEQIQDAVSHEELVLLAERRREENSVYDKEVQIEHVSIPAVKVGTAVRYVNSQDGRIYDVIARVDQIDMRLDKTAMCTTKLKVLI